MVRVPIPRPRYPKSFYSRLPWGQNPRMCCSRDNTPTQKEKKRKISSRDLHKLAKMIGPSSRSYLFKYAITRHDQLIRKRKQRQAENRRILSQYVGTPRVPVYVMLPLGAINMQCKVVDCVSDVHHQFKDLASINVDGVTVVVWWGIVEAENPRQYKWIGYEILFRMLQYRNLKIQVVMAFHECDDDDVYIPLPKWVKEIGEENPDIYFTDRDGRRNPEALSWGIDEERVLRGRTALEVYLEFMKSFRVEFDEFFKKRAITKIEVGLGACGELRYPSYPAKHGWEYPGIGEFQCYDKYLKKCLEKAAAEESRVWGSPPDNAGCYNSQPQDTGFFCDGGGYRTAYGSFFLNWYSQCLIDHADSVLAMAKRAFSEDTPIAIKLSGIPWWYKSDSHAAELTAGYYNMAGRDGYAPLASMLKKNQTALNFTCAESEGIPEAMADLEGLVSQVLNAAWDAGIQVASENAFPGHDRQGYNKILELAKPRNDPDGRHLSAFTCHWIDDDLFEEANLKEFELFVRRMHGTPSFLLF